MENQNDKFKIYNKKLGSVWRSEQLTATRKLILKEAYKKSALVKDPAWPDILRELAVEIIQEIFVDLWFLRDVCRPRSLNSGNGL
jgi:hypothetical protein